jgi:hypothetical protein
MRRLIAQVVQLFRDRSAPAPASLKTPAVVPQPNIRYTSLELADSNIEEIPPGVSVQFRLSLRGCTRLHSLPDNLRVGTLDVSGCTALRRLPEGLEATFVDISDCPQLEGWPITGKVDVGRLRARNCSGLRTLPTWLGRVAQLDLAGCVQINSLPEGLEVTSWADVAGTGIRSLPNSLTDVSLRWRGVTVDERIAFRPEEITPAEVLAQPNAELRRVMLERVGLERFVEEANCEVLDTDSAPGGSRTLYRVALDGDEPLVCVSVGCPSTGRRYLLRVPPTTTTCHQAVAWTAGFDDPNQYKPLCET